MRIAKFVFVFAALMCFSISAANSNASADSTAWHLVAQGKAFLAENKLKEAEQSFKKALKKDRELTAAMTGLGEVCVAKNDWGEANDWYEKVLDREPENLDALYHRAICYRECGVPKALIMRKFDWDNAAKYFKRVLAHDSSFYDTLYQYAQLLRYKKDYTDAIAMGHDQIRLKPEDVGAQRGLFRLYHYYLDNAGASEILAWLQQSNSEQARYFIGETYRHDDKLPKADSVFRQLLAGAPNVSLAPIYLSLARLYYEQKKTKAAEKAFWQAVDGIRNRLDAELVFEDVKYIVTEAELQQFRQAAAVRDYVDFFHRVFMMRDPTPAADNNVRLAEHYRRLLYAENHYVFDGFRTWFNNPDKMHYQKFPPTFYLNDRFNDKGLIYIRQGEPDERAVTAGQALVSNESWRYKPTVASPEMIFHFVVDENAVGNNWRLTPFINDPQFLEDRITWGTAYERLLRGNPLEQMALEEDLAQQSREAVDTGFRTDRHSWDKNVQPLIAFAYPAFFKAPEGKSYFDLYYALPLPSSDDLAKAGAMGSTVLAEHGVVLHDLQWNRVHRLHDQITKHDIANPNQTPFLIGQYHFAVKPDSYHVAFFVQQPATKRVGGWKDDMRVPQFNDGQLAMSSIVLASAIEPAINNDADLFVRHGLRILPNPYKRFSRAKPVYIYFELYNLTPDAEGKAAFVVEYTTLLRKEKKSGAKKVFSLFGGGAKPSTTLVMEREANATTSMEYLALDLARAGAGDFRLSIKVKEKNSGKQSEGFIDLTLF
jgi:tetratricopeptide (TPR) repeat protein